MTNCPRCNMFLAPGAQVCPNCQLNLMQFAYQQPQFGVPPVMGDAPETKTEKRYRLLLLILVFLVLSELITYRIPSLVGDWLHWDMYTMLKPLRWLSTIAWAAAPFTVAMLLPRKDKLKVLLIILGAVYGLWHLGSFVYYEWVYTYNDYEYMNF